MPPSAWLLIVPCGRLEWYGHRRRRPRTRSSRFKQGLMIDNSFNQSSRRGGSRRTHVTSSLSDTGAAGEHHWEETQLTPTVSDFDLLTLQPDIMHQLFLTFLLMCLWMMEHCHGNSSLGNSLNDLHTRFGVSLYQTLTETENSSNLIVSPASISLCLGLLQLGARGNTLAQLEGTLGYDVNDARVQDILSQPQGDLGNSSKGVRLQLANALFVQSGVKLLPEFTQHVLDWGNSSILSVNFNHSNYTHTQLQQWARYQSRADEHHHIRQSAGPQEEASRKDTLPHMALLSTVMFHGAWQKQFHITETQNLPFILSDGSIVKVPMMYQSTEVNFGQFRLPSEQQYTVLELPYLDHSLRLLVALPADRQTPLSQLESQLTARVVRLWDTGLRRTKMDIFLPRFKMESRFNLKPVLQSLGISDVFSPSAADFRGISDGERLFVSEAFHEAKIEVTEEGTRAASATVMVLLKRSRSAVFKADRPFLFILRQISTGSLLFIGRVLNPADMH